MPKPDSRLRSEASPRGGQWSPYRSHRARQGHLRSTLSVPPLEPPVVLVLQHGPHLLGHLDLSPARVGE
eukprot:4861165-Pyramimonas_sp.AAC.1